jgi:transcriptional regulator with XRE-family HTH domain
VRGEWHPGLHVRIKQLRKAQGMTVRELAERAGVSPSYIYAIESGTRGSQIKKLAAIAKALGVPLQCILEENGQ